MVLRTFRIAVLATVVVVAACSTPAGDPPQPPPPPPPVELTGTVVIAEVGGAQTPAAGAVVTFGGGAFRFFSNAAGRFAIRSIPAGSYAVTITHDANLDGVDEATLAVNLEMKAVANDAGTLVLGAFGGIDVLVTRDGTPVPGAHVAVSGLDAALTGSNGKASFRRVTPGSLRVGAVDGDFSGVATAVVNAGQNSVLTVALTAAAPAKVSGRIVRLGVTAPVELVLTPWEGDVVRATAGPDGEWSADGLPAGLYRVNARANGAVPVVVPAFLVVGESKLPDVVLPAASLSCGREGATADADGDGIGDACDRCPGKADSTLGEDGSGCTATPSVLQPTERRPSPDATGVPFDVIASVTFASEVDAHRVDPGSMTITAQGSQVAGRVVPVGKTLEFRPFGDLAPSTAHEVRVAAGIHDIAGNVVTDPVTWTFTTSEDTTPPSVVSVVPGDLAIVPLSSKVVLQLSEDVREEARAGFAVTTGGASVPGTTTLDGDRITFTPSSPFAAGRTFEVSLAAGVRDLAGNRLAAAHTSGFDTPPPDSEPPSIVSSSPVDGAIDVVTGAPVTIAFSEAMDPATATAATIRLEKNGSALEATRAWLGDVLTITPTGELERETMYAVVLEGLEDFAGNPLPATTITFETTRPPTRTAFQPAADATNVSVKPTITMSWSEPVSPDAIGTSRLSVLRDGATFDEPFTWQVVAGELRGRPNGFLAYATSYTMTAGPGTIDDLAGNTTETAYSWRFTTRASPAAPLTMPAAGATAEKPTTPITFTFGEDVAVPGTTSLTANGVTISSTAAAAGPVVTVTPAAPLPYGKAIVVTLADHLTASGEPLPVTSVAFTTRAQPSATSPSPAAGSQVSTAPTELSFAAEEPAATTLNATNFTVKLGGSDVAGTRSYSAGRVRFVPGAALGMGTYTVGVTAQLTNLDGDPFVPSSWTFTLSGPPPSVTATAPTTGSTIRIYGVATATFSEAMDANSVISAFTLADTGNIAGTATYDVPTRTATFKPTAPLTYAKTYTARIAATARNSSGTTLAAAVSWPVVTMVKPPVKSIFAGVDHNCALRTDGSAVCWGENDLGGLGNGTSTRSTAPVAVLDPEPFSTLGAGNYFSCGLRESGKMMCWGDASSLGIGVSTSVTRSVPMPVTTTETFTALAVSEPSACAIATTGALYCWGANQYNEAGTTNYPQLFPFRVGGTTTYTAVGMGQYTAMAISSAGAAFGWGYFPSAAGGSSTLPRAWGVTTDWARVVPGGVAMYVFKQNGTLWATGTNANGELAQPSNVTVSTTPVQVGAAINWKSLSAGYNHACGFDQADQLWCFGMNNMGQVGDGTTTTPVRTPTAIGAPGAFKQVSLGYDFTLALDAQDRIVAWGNRQFALATGGGSVATTAPMLLGTQP